MGKWRLNTNGDCWVCQRWKYVLIFFDMDSSNHNSKIIQKVTDAKLIKLLENKHKINEIPNKHYHPVVMGSVNDFKPALLLKLIDLLQFNDLNFKKKYMENHKSYEKKLLDLNKKKSSNDLLLKQKHIQDKQKQISEGLKVNLDLQVIENLPYAQPNSVVVNFPSDQQLFNIQNMHLSGQYVFCGYVKPGTHYVYIKDPISGDLFQINIHLGLRECDAKRGTMSTDDDHIEQSNY